MKTKYWIALLAGILAVCVGLSLALFWPEQAACARIYSEGKLLYTLDLRVDTQVTVRTDRGENVITVRDGKIAVTQADCPDGHCVGRGFHDGGSPIVCLPNRLVIQFSAEQAVDGVTG